ncbi:malonyl CoA-acyl carrier protein transacylase [Xenococcus sp. PCC 7305]|uniref:ACP S-malonyltransferase n=1 Tax=Xenococcus sp. PCC 7305 TaxID=102125 RepID=UPI0002AC67EB|nr:ACP S-malonyltransferase [Xenococcus sp. PCC 7305]ELS02666.1 malonyl CoA-acyl carrier protein transacylase [Xenococcus sp. PCC 7305]
MTKTAWVFPGQGSQAIGMGVDFQENPVAKHKFELAEKILGWSVLDICQGDETNLSHTLYTQPCLYVVESIIADLLLEKTTAPQLVAGHSLGEYVALYISGVFDFESGLRLVKKRSELMSKAAGGKMAALMKFDRSQLENLIDANPDVVLANDNSSGQVVISGTPEAVEQVLAEVNAKRKVELNVSGAFHSPLMAEASGQFQSVLEGVTFNDAKIPVLSNVEPSPATKGAELKQRLAQQMTGSVKWREIMEQLSQQEITETIEVGPGKVLTGLLKRACKGMELGTIGTMEALDKLGNG